LIDILGKNGIARWTPPSFWKSIKAGLDSGMLAGDRTQNTDSYDSVDVMGMDPAFRVPGMAPNFGQYIVPHVSSFQGLFGTFSRVYRASDEALIDSLDNARYMRNDIGIMECLEARKRAVALLPWHIEPENENDAEEQELASQVTRIIKRIKRFTQYRECLLDATWFGRYAIQHRYGWVDIGGHERVMPCKLRDDPGWKPVHGDKLVWRYDDGTGKYITDQVGIRVGQKLGAGAKINQRWEIEPTDRGLAYFLADWERPMLAIHRHTVEDGAFEDPIQAGMVHGVGIRHRVYWEWFQKQEALAFLMEYLERSAGGIEVHYYPEGNYQARLRAEAAVKERVANGRNVMLYPRPVGDDANLYGMEFIEPGVEGVAVLKELLTDYFGHRIKRYILGQTLSSEATATGLGSGVADLHYDTLQQIVRYDAVNLEETITDDLVRIIQTWNFPASKGIYLRFRIEVETPDVKDKLEAYQTAWEMGAKISNREVMDTIGATIPDSTEDVLQNPQFQQQAAGNQVQGFGPGANGQQPPAGPSLEESLTSKLLTTPDGAGPGEVAYANEAGKWEARTVPEFDTGERQRAHDGDVVHFQRKGEPQQIQKPGRAFRQKNTKTPAADLDSRLFVYGTLRDLGLDELITGDKVAETPATLTGWKKVALPRGDGYFTIERAEGSEVEGDLIDVSPEDLDALDDWEHGEYLLQRIEMDDGHAAYTYVWKDEPNELYAKAQDFREQEHPRHEDGRFADQSGETGGNRKKASARKPAKTADSLGIPRDEMPQVPKARLPAFLDELKRQGIEFKHVARKPDELRPTQKDLDPKKVADIRKKMKSGELRATSPVLGSSDDYILDGHHRWEAQRQENAGEPMNIVQVDLPIRRLLERSLEWQKAEEAKPSETREALPNPPVLDMKTAFSRGFVKTVVKYRLNAATIKAIYKRANP
jgi:phage gp29-like protein/gamma-glutamylcyclotransferase (GGCT)/AIG2-like uncharacterized protein YtfP